MPCRISCCAEMSERDFASLPLDELMRRRAADDGDRPALVIDAQERPMSVGELVKLAGAAAARLAEWGVGPGDRLAILGQNSVAWAVWQLAAAWRGAATVAYHPGLSS